MSSHRTIRSRQFLIAVLVLNTLSVCVNLWNLFHDNITARGGPLLCIAILVGINAVLAICAVGALITNYQHGLYKKV